jgi:hypothetical protein
MLLEDRSVPDTDSNSTMAPVKLTLLCLPAEIRNKVWRFALPRRPDLEVDACLPAEEPSADPSTPCKFVDLKRYNWKDESLLVVNHQTREEIDPWIVREKRILKFCTDKCLERFLRETGDDRTSRGGRAKALDDIKVHLVVALGPPPHSRMGKAVAKMRVAGEIQKLIARLRPEIITVDLMPIEIIQEAGTTQEMHVWARFVVKAWREMPRMLIRESSSSSGEADLTVFKSARLVENRLNKLCRQQDEDRRTLLRSRRTLRTTRSTAELLLRESQSREEAALAAQSRAGMKRTRQPRTNPRAPQRSGDLQDEDSIASGLRWANERSMLPLVSGGRRQQQVRISDYLDGRGPYGDVSDEE